jgi:predicted nucleic acid-binding protein
MAYVDTNVLISYYFDEEEFHEVSTRIFNVLKTIQKKIYISPLTLVELYSVIARNLSKYRLPPHYMVLDEKRKIHVLVKDILECSKPILVDDESKLELLDKSSVFYIYKKAIDYVTTLKLKSLDLMHITYAIELAKRGLVDTFITLDKELISRKQVLEGLGLKVMDFS